MFWLEEGLPGSLAPGKRPRTTLTPTLAHRDGEPYMVWGSPGGDQQDQWITQMFMRHVHCGMNLQEAIDAPAWHSEHFPSSFWPRTANPGKLVIESLVPKKTIDELERRGHKIEVGPAWSEGRLTAASRVGRRRRGDLADVAVAIVVAHPVQASLVDDQAEPATDALFGQPRRVAASEVDGDSRGGGLGADFAALFLRRLGLPTGVGPRACFV